MLSVGLSPFIWCGGRMEREYPGGREYYGVVTVMRVPWVGVMKKKGSGLWSAGYGCEAAGVDFGFRCVHII